MMTLFVFLFKLCGHILYLLDMEEIMPGKYVELILTDGNIYIVRAVYYLICMTQPTVGVSEWGNMIY